jgi:hypothetical protein
MSSALRTLWRQVSGKLDGALSAELAADVLAADVGREDDKSLAYAATALLSRRAPFLPAAIPVRLRGPRPALHCHCASCRPAGPHTASSFGQLGR